jgi:cytochrome c oxidase assembly factor CtaG
VTTRELILQGWTLRPVVVLIVAAALAAYFLRCRPLHASRVAALLGAAAAVLVALLSPVDLLARGTLFSAHMLQHMLLVLAVPPLALLAIPRRAGPPSAVRLPSSVACWGLGVGAMWIWHAPALCNAAATNDGVRAFQSASLVAMGAAFWWPLVGPHLDRRLAEGAAVAYLVTACGACTVLGIVLAFSPVEVCTAYAHPADPLGLLPLVRGQWGLTPAADQQLGGLLMWVPGCAVYAACILGVVARFHGAARPGAQGASP